MWLTRLIMRGHARSLERRADRFERATLAHLLVDEVALMRAKAADLRRRVA